MKQHGAANEIEAQEHWQREYEVDGHFGAPLFVRVRDLCRPDEREVARYWVYEAHEHFYTHLRDSLPCHCDAPVFDAVVDYEQLNFLIIISNYLTSDSNLKLCCYVGLLELLKRGITE